MLKVILLLFLIQVFNIGVGQNDQKVNDLMKDFDGYVSLIEVSSLEKSFCVFSEDKLDYINFNIKDSVVTLNESKVYFLYYGVSGFPRLFKNLFCVSSSKEWLESIPYFNPKEEKKRKINELDYSIITLKLKLSAISYEDYKSHFEGSYGDIQDMSFSPYEFSLSNLVSQNKLLIVNCFP